MTDPAIQDYTTRPLDQAKTLFLSDAKGFSDALGKTIALERALQAPAQATIFQQDHLSLITGAKNYYDAAITHVSQATTMTQFNTAFATLATGIDKTRQGEHTLLNISDPAVRDALNNAQCNWY